MPYISRPNLPGTSGSQTGTDREPWCPQVRQLRASSAEAAYLRITTMPSFRKPEYAMKG